MVIRRASDDEVLALRRTRLGREFELEPVRDVRLVEPDGGSELGGIHVFGQAFADLGRDAKTELLRFADDVAQEGLLGLLGDMGSRASACLAGR